MRVSRLAEKPGKLLKPKADNPMNYAICVRPTSHWAGRLMRNARFIENKMTEYIFSDNQEDNEFHRLRLLEDSFDKKTKAILHDAGIKKRMEMLRLQKL